MSFPHVKPHSPKSDDFRWKVGHSGEIWDTFRLRERDRMPR